MTATTTDLAGYPARYFAAWNRRDLDTALTAIAETVHWVDPSLPEPITNHEQAGNFFTASWAGFPDLTFEAVGAPLVDTPNRRVTQEWRMTGTHTGADFPPGVPASGRSFDIPGMDVWEVDGDGRAVSVHAYWNVAALLAQLGLN